jgi:hypothetical protein
MSQSTSEVAVLRASGGKGTLHRARWLERAGLAVGGFALFALGWRHMDLLGDSFWSVAAGRWILEHGSLPSVDPVSFTAERPWIVHMPLCQVLFAWVEAQFGVLGLELFGSLVSSTAVLVLWLGSARSFAARLALWPALVLLIVVQADDLCVRGQLFGDLGYALLLGALFRLRNGRAWSPLLWVVLGAFWINLHASVFLAVVLPLVCGLAQRVLPGSERRPLGPFVVASAAAALGLLCNPHGFALVSDLIALLRASSTASLDLFGPPDFTALPTLLLFAVLGCSAIGLARSASPRAGWPEVAVLALLTVAAARGRRYEPLALGFAIAAVGRALDEPLSRRLSAAVRGALGALVSLAALGLAAYGLAPDKDPWRDVPLEEAAAVERAALPDRIANLYHWGGYLDYAWAGRRKVFIDGRNQLFDRQVFHDFERLDRLDGWQEVLDRYAINTVLWESGSALDRELLASSAWAPVVRGRLAVVYVRRRLLPAPVALLPAGG